MSRNFPRGTKTPDANRLDTRINARSILVDKPRSKLGLASRVVAKFLSRRNENSRSLHSLSAREGISKDNHVESSSSTSEKHINDKAKLNSENTTQNSTANAGSQKKPSEKANADDQKENGAKSAVENGKSLGNTDKLASGSQKPSISTGSLDSEAQKSPTNTVGPVSEGQKPPNSTPSSGSKVSKNPSDAGKSASNGLTNGTNVVPEAQKDKDKNQNTSQNQKPDVSKEKGKDNADLNKSTQGKSSTPPVDSTKAKSAGDKEVKNAATLSSAPKTESSPLIIPQDNKDTGPEGANTEKNNLPPVDESAQNQPSSLENVKLTEKIDPNEINVSSSLGTDLPLDNSNLEVAPITDKDSLNENEKDLVPSSSLTPSAKASLDSDIPKISAVQSTKNDSHSDVVKWLASIFGVLLLLTIIIYIIRLCLRHRRIAKAESPPQSPLLNHMEPMSRGFSNNMSYNRDFNNNSHNFNPFQEEERLRTMEMNKTYGRVV